MAKPDPTTPSTAPASSDPLRWLLWVDCGGGLLVGGGMLLFASWLEVWYRLPEPWFDAVALANLTYGAYSLTLAARPRRLRRPWMIAALAGANALWSVICVILLGTVAAEASLLGKLHLFNEAVFVGTLAWIEWRRRAGLAAGR